MDLWPSFGRSVCDLAMEFDVGLLINLGAYPAATPHTRPPHLTATATSAELSHQLGFLRTTIDVPSGIHAVVEHECAARIPSQDSEPAESRHRRIESLTARAGCFTFRGANPNVHQGS